MKRLWMLGFAVALMGGIGRCAESTLDNPDVPFTHWAYAALDTLSKAGVVERRISSGGMHAWEMTRYEFALAVVRAIKTENFKFQRDYDERTGTYFLERHDALMALRQEFASELLSMGVQIKAQSPISPIGAKKQAATR